MASVCILATRGRLNVSTSLVDDEGVDLVFHLPNSVATLAVEMKARMTEGAMVGRGPSKPKSGHRPSRPREDLDMLFVLVDNARAPSTPPGSSPASTSRTGTDGRRRPALLSGDQPGQHRQVVAVPADRSRIAAGGR